MRPIRVVVVFILIVLLGVGLRHVLAKEGPAELISLLQDENPAVQFKAAYALGALGADARSAVPTLIEMLRSGDSDRTEIATFVLARIAPDPAIKPAVPLLIETVRGGKGWVAGYNAAVALLKLGREEEEKALEVIRDGTNLSLMIPLLEGGDPLNRLHVCEALMLSGPPRRDFLDLLRKTAAEDPDSRVREAALEALRKVGAAEHAALPDTAPKALSTLPPELAEAGRALIELQSALENGDVDGFKKHLPREAREEFERSPRMNFASYQYERHTGLRLLGGTREGDSAVIDYFSTTGISSHGTVTMVREDGRWVHSFASDYPGYSEPYIDDSTPVGLNETAAFALLKAVAAGQIYHWHRAKTYADSMAKLDLPDRPPGYVVTLTAGAKSNGIHHAWSAEAHPERYPETGIHSYYIDERGVILQSDTRGLPLTLEMPER